MRAPSLARLAFVSLVVVPWSAASADDAPPSPPPAPREASDEAARDPYQPHPIPGIRFVTHKVEDGWLLRWIQQPGAYKLRLVTPKFYVSPLPGLDLRAEPPPPASPPAPASPEAPQATSLPPGIVAMGELPARIASARAAGREKEAVELRAALDALNREQEGTDARSRIVWIGAGETLRGERLTVDEQELPPGKYAVVRSELGPRTVRATLRATGGSKVTVAGWGTRYETIAASGERTIRFLEAPDTQGTSIGGTRVQVPTHPPILPGTLGQPFTVTRNADGTNTITFTTAPGPTRPGPGSSSPGLSKAIDELRGEIRALREEIRALRTALEGSPGPK